MSLNNIDKETARGIALVKSSRSRPLLVGTIIGSLSLTFLVSSFVLSHYVNTSKSKDSRPSPTRVSNSKSSFNALVPISSLDATATPTDIIYTQEYQESRAKRTFNLDKLEEALGSVSSFAQLEKTAMVESPNGEMILTFVTPDTTVLSFSLTRGLVGFATQSPESSLAVSQSLLGVSSLDDLGNKKFVKVDDHTMSGFIKEGYKPLNVPFPLYKVGKANFDVSKIISDSKDMVMSASRKYNLLPSFVEVLYLLETDFGERPLSEVNSLLEGIYSERAFNARLTESASFDEVIALALASKNVPVKDFVGSAYAISTASSIRDWDKELYSDGIKTVYDFPSAIISIAKTGSLEEADIIRKISLGSDSVGQLDIVSNPKGADKLIYDDELASLKARAKQSDDNTLDYVLGSPIRDNRSWLSKKFDYLKGYHYWQPVDVLKKGDHILGLDKSKFLVHISAFIDYMKLPKTFKLSKVEQTASGYSKVSDSKGKNVYLLNNNGSVVGYFSDNLSYNKAVKTKGFKPVEDKSTGLRGILAGNLVLSLTEKKVDNLDKYGDDSPYKTWHMFPLNQKLFGNLDGYKPVSYLSVKLTSSYSGLSLMLFKNPNKGYLLVSPSGIVVGAPKSEKWFEYNKKNGKTLTKIKIKGETLWLNNGD